MASPKPQLRPKRPGPSVPRLLGRGLRKKCPACAQGHLFQRWFHIAERCPRCGLKFERIDGHWVGAIGITTIITFGILLLSLILALIFFINSDVPRWYVGVILMAVGLLVPPLIDPLARTFWTAIDISMRPLKPHEVDWMVVDPSMFSADISGTNTDAGNTSAQSSLTQSDHTTNEDS